MASLTFRKKSALIQVVVGDKRPTVRIGKVSKSTARGVLGHIEELANAVNFGQPIAAPTASWLNTVSAKLFKRIAKAGLARVRAEKISSRIGDFTQGYLDRRTDLKERTLANLIQARKSLLTFFDPNTEVSSIGIAEAKDWRRHASKLFSPATVSGHTMKSRQMFSDAVERGIIEKNPFKFIRSGSQTNEQRQRYISVEDIELVIAKCSPEWKLVFALARLGGLRIPSEIRELKWTDIDFDAGTLTVTSPKTAHHPGKDTRTIPLFVALRPYLMDAFESKVPGSDDFVFNNRSLTNFGTTAKKIIRRAGLMPWPKTFQNLRASCETDLALSHPIQAVCKWIGNSQAIARKHYLLVHDADFAAASGRVPKSTSKSISRLDGMAGGLTAANAETGLKMLLSDQESTRVRGETSRRKQAQFHDRAHKATQKALHAAIRKLEDYDRESLAQISVSLAAARGRLGEN